MKFFKFLFIISVWFYTGIALSNTTPRVWSSAEYLYWWVENSSISVPLVTRNNNPGAFGIIGEPGTQIIFGAGSNKNTFNLNGLNGGRLTIGSWLDESYRYGIEAIGFDLAQINSTYRISSLNGAIPIINIPFFSTNTGRENVLVNRLPNTVTVSNTFQPFGLELNGLYSLQSCLCSPIVLLAGFRYINIKENLILNDAIYNAPSFLNSVVNVRDNFSTKNKFFGFQLGASHNTNYKNFLFEVAAKIALGQTRQILNINGQTNVDNHILLQPIGLFAEPTNSGTFQKNQFAFLPEVNAKIGYKFNKFIHPFISYNVLYLSNVIRPGKELDRNINLTQNPLIGGTGILLSPAAPIPRFNTTGIWLQGLGAGIELELD